MPDERPTFGSLFAGIGGIDLGLERAGWECRFQVEWSEFCQSGLAKHWPELDRHGDIVGVDWSHVERVDLLAGGFPCQPISSAGRGKAQADERWLWPEFIRAIRALRPGIVLVENVTNLLGINDATAFGDVLGDLAASGYDAEWDCIPASALGALHERDRLWLIAYPNGDGCDAASGRQEGSEGPALGAAISPGQHGSSAASRPLRGAGTPVADAPSNGRGWSGRLDPGGQGQPELALQAVADPQRLRLTRPRQLVEPIHSEALAAWKANPALDGGWWAVEPPVGRLVDGFSDDVARWREAALQALGNAVVPQVVEMIGTQLLASLRAVA